jgi:hypothetical protein
MLALVVAAIRDPRRHTTYTERHLCELDAGVC